MCEHGNAQMTRDRANKIRAASIPIVILTMTALVACNRAGNATVSQPAQATDYQSLIDKLRAGGVSVDPAADGRLSQPFFSVPGRLVVVAGDPIQVFEYENTEAAESESRRVSPNGASVGTTMITWAGAPHFYKNGRLVVIYVGSNEEVLEALEKVLGPQFAGE